MLDDYHAIGSAAVHDFLNGLIRHWPQPMHLVLIARSNPALPLASLRAKGQVSEIRSRDLRFTPEESAAFLDAALPAPLNRSSVVLLEQRAEGWIAGLRLATLSLHTEHEVAAALESLSSANADIADYLVDEVLSRQPPAIQMFLLKTAILNQFCASLCEAVVGSDDAEFTASICMEWIEHANLFIIPLDNHSEWYRYHHLFQELLQRRLQADVGARTDMRSTLSGGGLARAARAGGGSVATRPDCQRPRPGCPIDGAGTVRRAQPRRSAHVGALAALAAGRDHRARPGMLMIKAWALQLSWQLDAQSKVIKQVEALIAKG